MCCWCVDALEVALNADVPQGGAVLELEAYRVNRDTEHCSCCEYCGRDVLVAAIQDDVFAAPPAAFLASRRP